MLRITPKQARTVHRLARDQCCNCTDGNCLLLDDGDSHPCVQMISYYGIYCKYFLNAVLPAERKLYEQIIEQNELRSERRNEE